MKKIIIAATCLSLFLAFSSASAVPILIVTPAATEVEVGSTVDVTVSISGLTGEGVGDYDLALFFDEGILDFVDVAFYEFLDGPDDSLQLAFDFFGELDVIEISFGSLLNQVGLSSFNLFTATFDVIDVGTSALDLGVFAIGDFYGDPLDVEIQNSSLTAVASTAVPEPGTFALLLIGLAGMASVRVRRQFKEQRNIG